MEDTTAHINTTSIEYISKLGVSQELVCFLLSHTTLAQKGKAYFLSDVFQWPIICLGSLFEYEKNYAFVSKGEKKQESLVVFLH